MRFLGKSHQPPPPADPGRSLDQIVAKKPTFTIPFDESNAGRIAVYLMYSFLTLILLLLVARP